MNTALTIKKVWERDDEYTLHRIPGMIVTSKGTILIYNEARRQANDWAHMDIILERSEDGGKTFGDPVFIARGTDRVKTVNNPVAIEDKNGRIHFLHCEDYTINGGRALHLYSDDDGRTWSEPEDITPSTNPALHNAFAFGPGHGICTDDGTLIVPIWMVYKALERPIDAHWPSVISTLYSKDCGKTWQMGEIIPEREGLISPNETEIALLEDGSVYLNCRLGGDCFYRGRAYSKTGYSYWQGYEPDKALIDPHCFGAVISVNEEGRPHTLVFANCETLNARDHVTLKASVDGGKTWKYRRLLDETRGGYVELSYDHIRKNILVLYEDKAGETVHLATLPYEWLTENE